MDKNRVQKQRKKLSTNCRRPKNGREYKYGFLQAAMHQFGVKSQQTIIGRKDGKLVGRLAEFPNGVNDASKHHAGIENVTVQQWEQTECYQKLIGMSGTFDAKTQRLTKKGNKYNTPLYKAYMVTGKKDPLRYDETIWLSLWGKDPKQPDQCNPAFIDTETRKIQYAYAVAFRWAMNHSKNVDVQELIRGKDDRFNTKKLKRQKGKHTSHYFSEEQCFILPKAINRIDTLILSYFGILFGGRFEALNALTPDKIDRTAHVLKVYESKISTLVKKPIYEPETSFIWQYITDQHIGIDKPLFGRSITSYNDELKATPKYFNQTAFPLQFIPTTHTAFKHTCVTQMSLHGVRMDTISKYIHTDPNTLLEFYQGGTSEQIDDEIGGVAKERKTATWRAFVQTLTKAFNERYRERQRGIAA